ncbi:MAG: potassium transporter TrkG, partial [Treponemataceae bacterium]
TTGFSTVGYTDWKPIGIHVLIMLMTIGGGICSTAGGLKQLRVAILVKAALKETRRLRSPRNAVLIGRISVGEDETPLSDRTVADAGAFAFFYFAALGIGTGILVASGFAFMPSVFEFASALGTVGLSVGVTSASAPDAALWGMTFGMFMGRLEFFVIFASLSYVGRRIVGAAGKRLSRIVGR